MKLKAIVIVTISVALIIGIALFNNKSSDSEMDTTLEINTEETIETATEVVETITTAEEFTTQQEITEEIVTIEQSTSQTTEVQTTLPQTETTTAKKPEQTTQKQEEQTTSSSSGNNKPEIIYNGDGTVTINGKTFKLGSDIPQEEMTTGNLDNVEAGKNYIGN